MRTLAKFETVDHWSFIPDTGTFVVLTQSKSGFLGKAIQGFMRLWQWVRGERDTDLIPNHADGVFDGYAVGALMFGVDGNYLYNHFSGNAKFYIIRPNFSLEQELMFKSFLSEQEGEEYAYLDIIKYAVNTVLIKLRWKKEPQDRVKWTCFSLVASALNYSFGKEIFPNPWKITPYEVCKIMDDNYGVLFT